MKNLMIAPQPFFAPRGTPSSVLGRLRNLSYLGHEVDLLTSYLGTDVTLLGVTLHRISPVPGIRQGLLQTHEEASFFGMALAKWLHLPHLYDMHFSLPQPLQNCGCQLARPLSQMFSWLERREIQFRELRIFTRVIEIQGSRLERELRNDLTSEAPRVLSGKL